jgi:type II secretory pathway predicted ATPase ExeA
MRLKLKRLLPALGINQTDLAKAVSVSPATICQLTNHGIWPRKNPPAAELRRAVIAHLRESGATAEQIESAFEIWPLTRANAAEAGDPSNGNDEEDEHMLLRNETLTLEARDHFNLMRSPFADDINSLADVFVCASTRRARAALMDAALNQGFLALVGESGSGKSTLCEELKERIRIENQPVAVISPYVSEADKSDRKVSYRPRQISEAIVRTLAPGEPVHQSAQGRMQQVHELLRDSRRAGYNNLLVLEEAHNVPKSTLRSLKSFMEMKDGLRRLLGVVLIGQPELDATLSDKLAEVREIVQRCERRQMLPLDDDLPAYIQHKFNRVGAKAGEVFAEDAFDAIRSRLVSIPRGGNVNEARSICYPLVVNNLIVRAMNAAAAVRFPKVNADVIKGC